MKKQTSAASYQQNIVACTAQAFDIQVLEALFARLVKDHRQDVRSVIVSIQNSVPLAAYFNGADSTSLHDVRSATKSVTALLLGIAIERGIVGSVDDQLRKYFPTIPANKAEIRIRDLLTMRAGFDVNERDSQSPGHELRMEASDDFLAFAFALPMAEEPGNKYRYASVTAFLVGALIEDASGLTLDQFALRFLFDPLGISRVHWLRGPKARVKGQGNLFLTAPDFCRIGTFVANPGAPQWREILSESWVRECLLSRVFIGDADRYADYYGYMWYSKRYFVRNHPVDVCFASGNGGNKLYLVPTLQLVISVMSSAYDQPYGQERSEAILREILAALPDSRLVKAQLPESAHFSDAPSHGRTQ